MSEQYQSGAWEDGPTTLYAAADYAHHIRQRLERVREGADGEDLEEALRLLDVLEGYLKLLQHESG